MARTGWEVVSGWGNRFPRNVIQHVWPRASDDVAANSFLPDRDTP